MERQSEETYASELSGDNMSCSSNIDGFSLRVFFPRYFSASNELRKAGLLRVLLGLLLLTRFAEILYSHHVISDFKEPFFVNNQIAIFFLAGALFTLGCFTQFSTIALLFLVHKIDRFFGTGTLGTTILSGTLLVMLLVNSGQYYSIDGLIISSRRFFCRMMKPFLLFVGANSLQEIQAAYFIGLLTYATCSFTALQYHLVDSSWVTGLTTKSLLTNSFLCKHYDWFRAFEVAYPSLFSMLSIGASVGQTLFQLFMIPLLFFRLGRWFVCMWGIVFFAISLFFINLSYLPHIELVLWALIFIPSGRSRPAILVFFDDRCNLCRATVRFIRWINYNAAVSLLAISQSRDAYVKAGLTEEQVQSEMVGIVNGKLVSGYDLYCAIARTNVLLWPLVPILWLGKIGRIGDALYRYIAARRRKFFGVCKTEGFPLNDEQSRPQYRVFRKCMRIGICSVVIWCCFMLLVVQSPGLTSVAQLIAPRGSLLKWRGYVRNFGLDTPIVFNQIDLTMGNIWMELYVEENGAWKLVPIRGQEGERLSYQNFDLLNFTNHNSDRLYFAETLKFARGMIAGSRNLGAFFGAQGRGYESIATRVKYDYHFLRRRGKARYKVVVRANRASEAVHWKANSERYQAKVILERTYEYGKRRGLREVEGSPAAP